MGTVLKALLQQRHIQTVAAFNREYDRHALKIDPVIVGCGPKKAQFYRWLSGDIAGLPYPHHRRILQAMFPGRSIEELFDQDGSGPRIRHDAMTQEAPRQRGHRTADVESVFPSRAAFTRDIPPQQLFESATTVDMIGISLNMLCQQYPEREIARLLESGSTIRCLFLDPEGEETRRRESEEGQVPGALAGLTTLNMGVLQRINEASDGVVPGTVRIRTYDQTARFNIVIVDSALCVVQPYLPFVRGLESPTFVVRRTEDAGVFDTFAGVFDGIWVRGKEMGG
ncbi:DUF5919 domain-containing protein [Nocardia sp. NPDC003963]